MNNELTYFNQEAYEELSTYLIGYLEAFAVPDRSDFYPILDYFAYVNISISRGCV